MRRLASPFMLMLIGALGCGVPARQHERAPEETRATPPTNIRDTTKILGNMGFTVQAVQDAPVTGALAASFDAPVTNDVTPAENTGTAQVSVDGNARSLRSQTILHAYADSDLTYVVLFDDAAPDFYVVIAAHAADLVDGAALPLDGERATAIVVDESSGTGRLAQGGSFSVTHAQAVEGGVIQGSVTTELVDVTLDAWPENLLPLTEDGQPTERAAVTGQGSFSAVFSTSREPQSGGASDVSVDIAGIASITTSAASAFPIDDTQPLTAIMLQDPSQPSRGLVIAVPTASLVDGAHITLGSLSAGAWIFLEDGTQVGAATGTLDIQSASLVEGGTVNGSITLSGNGYVMRCPDGNCGEPVDEEPVPECTADGSALLTFVPAGAAFETAEGGLPPPFDRILWLMDEAQTSGIAVLLRDDENLADGADLALGTVDVGGRPMSNAVWFEEACQAGLEITSGALALDPVTTETQRLTGSLTVAVGAETRTIAVDAALSTIEPGPSGQ